MDSVFYRIKTSQTVLGANLLVHGVSCFFWSFLPIVNGFGRYDAAPPASFHAVSHTGWWLAIEFFVVLFGVFAVLFTVQRVERGIALALLLTRRWLNFWMALVVGGIAANIVHLVASALEYSDCRSTLCLENGGFLIAMIVICAVLICVELFELYGIYRYKGRIDESADILIGESKKFR